MRWNCWRELLCVAIASCLPFGLLQANERPGEESRSPISITEAEADPLRVERKVDLFAEEDLSESFAIALSRPVEPEEQGALVNAISAAGAPGDAWLREMQDRFRALVAERAGSEAPDPEIFHNTAETDHRARLQEDGYTGLARRRQTVDGEQLWAALYQRKEPSPSAGLGEATASILIEFSPRFDENAAGRLNASAEPRLNPETAPEGVAQDQWDAARERKLEALREEANILVDRLNRRTIKPPAEAAYVFEAGEPYHMMLEGRYRGKQHQIRLVLRGEVATNAGENEVSPTPEEENAQLEQELSGGWILRLEHPEHGWLDGFAEINVSDSEYLYINYPDGPRSGKSGCGSDFDAQEQTVRFGCHRWRLMHLEPHPNRQRMRGYWYDQSSGNRSVDRIREEFEKLGKVLWRRMVPQIDSIEVGTSDGEPIDYETLRWPRGSKTMTGNKPWARLVLTGKELPRGSSSYGLDLISLPDPALSKASHRGNAEGTRFEVAFRLDSDVKPGRKILRLNDVEVLFDLEFENYPEEKILLRSLEFTGVSREGAAKVEDAGPPAVLLGDDGDFALAGGVEELRLDGTYVLEARYETASGDLVKYPKLRIERNGEPVYRFPKQRRRMTRGTHDTLYRTERLAFADLFGETPDVDARNAFDAILRKTFERARGERVPYTYQPGDVIAAELDGVVQRWPLVRPGGVLGYGGAPKDLYALSLDGTPIHEAAPGTPFILEAVFERAQSPEWIEAAIVPRSADSADDNSVASAARADTASRPVALRRQEDGMAGRAYRSRPLVLVRESGRSLEALIDQFAGVYRVAHMDYRGRPVAHGRAWVSEGGDIALSLHHSDGSEAEYHPVQVRADFYGEKAEPFRGAIVASFAPAEPSARELAPNMRNVRPDALPLSAEQEEIGFTVGETSVSLKIVPRDGTTDDGPLLIQVYARESLDKLTGAWSRKAADADGEASWIRADPTIVGVAVLDDQLAPMRAAYPFDEDSPSGALRTRTLVAYGHNLPEEAGLAQIESRSPGVNYTRVSPFRASGGGRRALRRAGVEGADSYEALALTAELDPEAAPGLQELVIDGAVGQWPLIFSDQFAAFSFTRSNGDLSRVFFPGDTAYVELAYLVDVNQREVEIRLFAGEGEDADERGLLTATRTEDPENAVYRAGPLHFVDAESATRRPPDDPGAIPLDVRPGDVFEVALLDQFKALPVPPRAQARIEEDPAELGPTWREALLRVAACKEEEVKAEPDLEAYQRERAKTFSKTFLTEILNLKRPRRMSRLLQFENGDHAAALLIRDEFLRMARHETLPKIRALAANREAVTALLDAAVRGRSAASLPLWNIYKATYETEEGETQEFSLKRALAYKRLAKRFRVSEAEMREWAIDETQSALAKQRRDVVEAVRRADAAGDCELEEILVLAGQSTEPLVRRVLPRLVKQETQADPPRSYWVADKAARAYVKNLHIGGAAHRALERYSNIEDSYRALALAAFTAGAGAVATGLGSATLGGAIVVAGDLGDAAYFGTQGIREYIEGEENYAYARGAAPLIGTEVLGEAAADRRSAIMAAFGLVAPAASATSSFRHLRSLRAINRGRRLLVSGDEVLEDLGRLSDAQRADLAAYYLDLARRADGRGSGLSVADQAAYERFQEYFRGADGARQAALQAGTDPAPSSSPFSHPVADTVTGGGAGARPGDAAATPDAPSQVADAVDPHADTVPPPTRPYSQDEGSGPQAGGQASDQQTARPGSTAPRFDPDADAVTGGGAVAQPGDAAAMPDAPSQMADAVDPHADTVPPPTQMNAGVPDAPAPDGTPVAPENGSVLGALADDPLYGDLVSSVEGGASSGAANAAGSMASLGAMVHLRDGMGPAARARADEAFSMAQDLVSVVPTILPGAPGARTADEALAALGRQVHLRAGRDASPVRLLADAVVNEGIEVTPTEFGRVTGLKPAEAAEALAAARQRAGLPSRDLPAAGTSPSSPEGAGLQRPLRTDHATAHRSNHAPPAPTPTAPRVEPDELTPSDLASLGDDFSDELVLGDVPLDEVLREGYKNPENLPRLHITDWDGLVAISRSGYLEAPARGGPNFSAPGVGAARLGDVAIRVRPEAERFIQWNAQQGARGHTPLYWESGRVGEGPVRTSIPTELLQYLDTGGHGRPARWRDFPERQ